MARKSEHEKTDGGRQSHRAAYERLHPGESKRPLGREIHEGPAKHGSPAEREAFFALLFQASSDGIVLHELRPSPQKGRFIDVNERMCQMETKHGLVVHVRTRGRTDSPAGPVRAFLYKAALELLFNVVKHAQVSEANLRLQRVRNQWRLTISDKGQGFDLQSLAETAGCGLLSVRERAEFLGGRMKIRTARGKGSTFLIAVPDTAAPKSQV